MGACALTPTPSGTTNAGSSPVSPDRTARTASGNRDRVARSVTRRPVRWPGHRTTSGTWYMASWVPIRWLTAGGSLARAVSSPNPSPWSPANTTSVPSRTPASSRLRTIASNIASVWRTAPSYIASRRAANPSDVWPDRNSQCHLYPIDSWISRARSSLQRSYSASGSYGRWGSIRFTHAAQGSSVESTHSPRRSAYQKPFGHSPRSPPVSCSGGTVSGVPRTWSNGRSSPLSWSVRKGLSENSPVAYPSAARSSKTVVPASSSIVWSNPCSGTSYPVNRLTWLGTVQLLGLRACV